MVIFPLSWPGKIVLMIIAIILGLMFWMVAKPEHWMWLRKKKDDDAQGKK